MQGIFNPTENALRSYIHEEGLFYTLNRIGQVELRNLRKEDKEFSHEKFYNNECDAYNYLYYENFSCYHNEAKGSDYFRRGCFIKEGMKVLDLGANIGMFAMSAIERGASKVYCFEPIRATYNCLMLNSLRYPENEIETYNIGISDFSGTSTFSLHTDWSHNGGGKMNSLQNADNNSFYSENCAMIDVVSVFEDPIWGDVDFLKIDIEGAEQIVLSKIPDKALMRLECIAGEFHCHSAEFQIFQDSFIARCHNFGFQSYVLYQGDGTLRTIHLWKD